MTALNDTAADAALNVWIATLSPAPTDFQKNLIRVNLQPLIRAIFAGIGNLIVSRTERQHTVNTTTSSVTWADAFTQAISCTAGDVLDIQATLFASANAGGNTNIRIVVDDGGDQATGTLATVYASSPILTVPLQTYWTVGNTGSITVRVQYIAPAANTITMYGDTDQSGVISRMNITQFRP